MMKTSKRALISVSDKTNLELLARELTELGFEIISTGGTARYLKEQGFDVTPVEAVTGFPECLDGRVKTLHPKIHGGLLCRRDSADHLRQAEELELPLIDLVAINLYPFRETISNPASTFAQCVEQIDIGGPAMLRSAAKNFASVIVLTNPDDYQRVFNEIREQGDVSRQTRISLAHRVFEHTAAYDALIASYFARFDESSYDQTLTLSYEKADTLRYGENPQQQASFYREILAPAGSLTEAVQLQGKPLSYNNLADTDAALAMIKEFSRPTVVAVKHANPCGIASAETIEEAWTKAYEADPVSIFGGIIAQNRAVSAAEAEKMTELFLEVILAPDFTAEALEVLSAKKNLRLLKLPDLADPFVPGSRMLKQLYGGVLIQDYDQQNLADEVLTAVTRKQPEESDMADYLFALKVAKHVKSNAIVLVRNEQTVGIGPGQPNRITAAEIAIRQAGDKAKGAVLGSDAFFPFADTVEAAAAAGVKGIVQPGGSIRDQESIESCDRHDLVMIFTGIRHFRH